METSKSSRMVMRAAWHLATQALPNYSSKFSRHDFTLPQLFACLVIREHQKKSYRGVEVLLKDSPEWRDDIGLTKTPDHNTLSRAFTTLATVRRMNKMLDVTAGWFTDARILKLTKKPAAVDSTHFESRHVSRHFERRRKQTEESTSTKRLEKKDKRGSATRPRTTKKLPKATFVVAAACHLILSVCVGTGAGSDAPTFDRVTYDAWRRAPVKTIVGDAGFDSEANHRIARLDMNVRSIIPPGIGRPCKADSQPRGQFRRLMYQRFKRKADKKTYGQRWQAETVNSMIKRNLGSALRAKTAKRRELEMLLRVVTHNVMLAWESVETEQDIPILSLDCLTAKFRLSAAVRAVAA